MKVGDKVINNLKGGDHYKQAGTIFKIEGFEATQDHRIYIEYEDGKWSWIRRKDVEEISD